MYLLCCVVPERTGETERHVRVYNCGAVKENMYLLFLSGRLVVAGRHTEPEMQLTVRFCIASTLKY